MMLQLQRLLLHNGRQVQAARGDREYLDRDLGVQIQRSVCPDLHLLGSHDRAFPVRRVQEMSWGGYGNATGVELCGDLAQRGNGRWVQLMVSRFEGRLVQTHPLVGLRDHMRLSDRW